MSGTDKINFLRSARRREESARWIMPSLFTWKSYLVLLCSEIRDEKCKWHHYELNLEITFSWNYVHKCSYFIVCLAEKIVLAIFSSAFQLTNCSKLLFNSDEMNSLQLFCHYLSLLSFRCCCDSQMKLTLLPHKFQLKPNINDKFYVLYALSGKCTVKWLNLLQLRQKHFRKRTFWAFTAAINFDSQENRLHARIFL